MQLKQGTMLKEDLDGIVMDFLLNKKLIRSLALHTKKIMQRLALKSIMMSVEAL